MKKPKITISLDKGLLDLVDSKVDNSIIRSRSQAVEFFLRKGLQEQSINTAVLLIKGEHQKNLLKKLKGKSLIKNQIEFFIKYGINNLYIVTQHTKNINLLLNEISESNINVEIIEKEAKGNAEALQAIEDKIKNSFIVMSGDIYNNFDMFKMIKKIVNILLDYVAYVILGLLGLAIFKLLVLVSYTETGKATLVLVGTVLAIIWAIHRSLKSLKG